VRFELVPRRRLAVFLSIATLSLLDATTTYLLALRYGCGPELNVLVRELCVAGRELVFAYAAVESAGFALLHEVALRVKEKLKLRRRVELAVLVPLALAVLSNAAGLVLGN